MLFLCLGIAQGQGQIEGGIKGGINYNSDSFADVKDDVFKGAESKTGYHAGIWLGIKLPITNLYIRPELVYTQLSNKVTYKQSTAGVAGFENRATTYEFQKIDIPVLVGYKLLNTISVFGGPSFQYILDSDFDLDDLKQVKSDGFSLGVQFGAGIELGKLGLDVRWERALSDTETKFVDSNTTDVNFDTRINQIIIGLSYKF